MYGTNLPCNRPFTVRVFDFLENKLYQLSLIITLFMTLFITVDAVTRYILGTPIPGAFELTEEYFMPALVFLAISAVYRKGGHVRVSLLLKYIPRPIQRPISYIMDLLSLLFSMVVAYGASITTFAAIQDHEKSMSLLAYPLAPAFALALIGFGFLTIRLVISFFYPIEYEE